MRFKRIICEQKWFNIPTLQIVAHLITFKNLFVKILLKFPNTKLKIRILHKNINQLKNFEY